MNQYLTNMKKQIITWYTYKGSVGEKNDGISKVVSGQSYSVTEALRRVQAGLPVSGRNYVYSDPDDELPPLKMKDLTDIDRAKAMLDEIKTRKKPKAAAREVPTSEQGEKAP